MAYKRVCVWLLLAVTLGFLLGVVGQRKTLPPGKTSLDTNETALESEFKSSTLTPISMSTPAAVMESLTEAFGAYSKSNLESADADDRLRPLRMLAYLEPAWILSYLQENPFEETWYNGYVCWAAAEGVMEQSPEDALVIIQSMETPMWRAHGLMDIASSLDESQQSRKLALLQESLIHARAIEAPDKRLAISALVANHLLNIQEVALATEILREGEKMAETMPKSEWPGYARGCLAEVLARIDLDAALALVDGYEDRSDHCRHHGNIAHKIASQNPAAAQRVLAMMDQPFYRERYSSRICYAMAPKDAVRARQIADAIGNLGYRAHTLGMMAWALSDSDSSLSQELLQQAYDLLNQWAQQCRDGGTPNPQYVGVTLLPVVEVVTPERLKESLWHTYSLGKGSNGVMAACLARYDKGLATYCLTSSQATDVTDCPFYYGGLAVLNAEDAIQKIQALPETTPEEARVKQRAWWQVVEVLRRDGQDRWDWLLDNQMNLWYVGKEDL